MILNITFYLPKKRFQRLRFQQPALQRQLSPLRSLETKIWCCLPPRTARGRKLLATTRLSLSPLRGGVERQPALTSYSTILPEVVRNAIYVGDLPYNRKEDLALDLQPLRLGVDRGSVSQSFFTCTSTSSADHTPKGIIYASIYVRPIGCTPWSLCTRRAHPWCMLGNTGHGHRNCAGKVNQLRAHGQCYSVSSRRLSQVEPCELSKTQGLCRRYDLPSSFESSICQNAQEFEYGLEFQTLDRNQTAAIVSLEERERRPASLGKLLRRLVSAFFHCSLPARLPAAGHLQRSAQCAFKDLMVR